MLHSKSLLAAITAATFAIGLTACGGGGGGTLPTGNAPSNPTTPLVQNATAQMTINIPAKTSSINHRNPKYISVSTQSMTIGLVASGKTTQLAEIDLTPSSKNCTALTGGGTQCNATFVGTAGTATYALSMFSGTGGNGNLLSTGDVQATLVAGKNTNIPIALDGVPSTVALVLGTASLPVGVASSTGVFVQAQDASGNIIVGPGGFSTGIGLAITNDPYSTLALSSAIVSSPGQVVTLNYNGGSNVGSTITPSIAGAAGTAATFAGSGVVMNLFQITGPATLPAGYSESFANEDMAAGPNGTATAMTLVYLEDSLPVCCTYPIDQYALTTLTPTGQKAIYVGDTSDPFNVPSVTPTNPPGMTFVHGMSNSMEDDEFEAYDGIAMGSNGQIYYSAYFTTSSDTTNCSGHSESSGLLGMFNPSTGVVQQYVTKGTPASIKVDSAGNVWMLLYGGTCNGTQLISGTYAIGELPVGGTSVKVTPFSTAGLSTSGYPSDMAITPDGSEMFISDEDNSTISKIATASLASPTSVSLTQSCCPYTVSAGADGTVAWWTDCDPGDYYFYGYVPGKSAFTTPNVGEVKYPFEDTEGSPSSTYIDGSFWAANEENESGMGIPRISGLSTGSPVNGFYQLPAADSVLQAVNGISGGGGYVWAGDDRYGLIDVYTYGAPTSGSITYATHRIGAITSQRRPSWLPAHTDHHAPNPHPHGNAH